MGLICPLETFSPWGVLSWDVLYVHQEYLNPLLLNISIRCFPHEKILDDILHGLPGQEVLLDVVEVLAVLLDGLLEEAGLGAAPVLHLVPAEDGPGGRDQAGQRSRDVIAVGVQGLREIEHTHCIRGL